jgi:hypothetical protein
LPIDEETLALIPPGGPGDYILEMDANSDVTPLLNTRLGYGHVRGCASGKAGETDTCSVELPEGGTFTWKVDHFDPERDFYPYPSAHFKAILCCEMLETLVHDPMYMMDEIHRTLRPGCHLVFTTRQYTSDQMRSLLENCGLEVALIESRGGRVSAVARKIGPMRERYPAWLYPDRR